MNEKQMMQAKNTYKARIDFMYGVRATLFGKVNGSCSFPRCKNPTIGPSIETDQAINMGVACHIYSTTTDGPHGRGGKDKAFIESEANGILCCQYHAALIDKINEIAYSAPALFAWKKLAEARTQKQINDVPSPLGWVESTEFVRLFPERLENPKVLLSRYTLITAMRARMS
jgi:hypothetical protein